MWAGVQSWLRGSLFEVNNYTNLTITAGLFIALMAILSVGLYVFHSRSSSLYFALITAGTYSLLFKISNLNLVGLFIMVMLFIHAEDIVAKEMKERIKMNPMALTRKGLTNFILAFFILISFAAYQSPAIESFKNIQKLPSSSEIFIKTVVENTVGAQIDSSSSAEKHLVLNQVSAETIHKANTFLEPYFQYAPPALAFGLFLVLWGVGWIFIWLSVFVGVFVFWILKKTKFLHIEERDVKAESIAI